MLAGRALLAVALLMAPVVARADNPMGYRVLSAEEAAALPHNRGALGLQVERARQISDAGLTFDVMRVARVSAGSAGARAGLRTGDQIIAVDGRVFPSIAAFAAYVGSNAPGTAIRVDYMPAGGGPQQAQRVSVVLGAPGQAAPHGMSTGEKVAIGAGAAAVLGCYAMGCFNHHAQAPAPP